MISKCNLSKFQMDEVSFTASNLSQKLLPWAILCFLFGVGCIIKQPIIQAEIRENLKGAKEGDILTCQQQTQVSCYPGKLSQPLHEVKFSAPRPAQSHLGFNCSLCAWHPGTLAPSYIAGSLRTETRFTLLAKSLWNPTQSRCMSQLMGKCASSEFI